MVKRTVRQPNPPEDARMVQQMARDFQQAIHEDRRRLQNPYSHLMDDGTFDALPCNPAPPFHDADGDQETIRDFQKAIREDRKRSQNPYFHLMNNGTFNADRVPNLEPMINIRSIINKRNRKKRFSEKYIKAVVRNLHTQLWINRDKILPETRQIDPIEILDPSIALHCIDYQHELSDSLGQISCEGKIVNVAGIIDRPNQIVRISRQFSPQVRKFTAAHELGHAILHEGESLHRDRALDGTSVGTKRDRVEFEADIFAKYFLMPEKQIRFAFELRFKTQIFVLNEETAFALNEKNMDALQAKLREPRDLSILLARATQYDGVQYCSLAEQFGVSVETMAIRLEELRMIRL